MLLAPCLFNHIPVLFQSRKEMLGLQIRRSLAERMASTRETPLSRSGYLLLLLAETRHSKFSRILQRKDLLELAPRQSNTPLQHSDHPVRPKRPLTEKEEATPDRSFVCKYHFKWLD